MERLLRRPPVRASFAGFFSSSYIDRGDDKSAKGGLGSRRSVAFPFFLSVARTMGQRTVCEKRTCRGGFEKCAGRGRGRTRTRERARGCARAARARRARRGRRPRPGSRTRGPAGRGWRRGQTARTARRLAERLPAGKRGVGGERASTHLRVGIVPRREHIRGHAEKRAARRGVGHLESDALRSARGIACFGRHG